MTQKFINEMVIVFYVLDGKVFWLVSERVNPRRVTKYQLLRQYLCELLRVERRFVFDVSAVF